MDNNTTTKTLNLTFKPSTLNGKKDPDPAFLSNILAEYTGWDGKRKKMPLYQIYYNSGNRLWGLWKCPYIPKPWERPKWYSTAQKALEKANFFFRTEDMTLVDLEESPDTGYSENPF